MQGADRASDLLDLAGNGPQAVGQVGRETFNAVRLDSGQQ